MRDTGRSFWHWLWLLYTYQMLLKYKLPNKTLPCWGQADNIKTTSITFPCESVPHQCRLSKCKCWRKYKLLQNSIIQHDPTYEISARQHPASCWVPCLKVSSKKFDKGENERSMCKAWRMHPKRHTDAVVHNRREHQSCTYLWRVHVRHKV